MHSSDCNCVCFWSAQPDHRPRSIISLSPGSVRSRSCSRFDFQYCRLPAWSSLGSTLCFSLVCTVVTCSRAAWKLGADLWWLLLQTFICSIKQKVIQKPEKLRSGCQHWNWVGPVCTFFKLQNNFINFHQVHICFNFSIDLDYPRINFCFSFLCLILLYRL